jgi:predicted lipoprotein with Yx(FWY)xxD motif
MPRPQNNLGRRRRLVWLVLAAAAIAGSAFAAVVAIAAGGSPTLRVAKNVHVTNAPTAAFRVKAVDVHEPVAVGPTGFAVYTFQGETTHHIICQKTNNQKTNCWSFWPPVSVKSAKGVSKASGITGKLGTFRNHGTLQLTLNGQPLYYFTPDITANKKSQATGDELKTFGSIWHIVRAAGAAHAAPAPAATTTTTTTSGTTTSTGPYSSGY